MNGTSAAHLAATVLDSNLQPIAGAAVAFATNYTGSLNPGQTTTGADGVARTTFTPSEVVTVRVAATTSGGLSDEVLIDVYQDNGAIRTTFEIMMDSQTETQSKYDIHAESRYVATGQPVANTDIHFTVLGETGQPFGELESQEDNSRGNPVTGRTNLLATPALS